MSELSGDYENNIEEEDIVDGEIGVGNQIDIESVNGENFANETNSIVFIETFQAKENEFSNQLLETPESVLEKAQESAEVFHKQSLHSILDLKGEYICDFQKERIFNSSNTMNVVALDEKSSFNGRFLYDGITSNIEIVNIDEKQLEKTTHHETEHLTSFNERNKIDNLDGKGYTVINSSGVRRGTFSVSENGELIHSESKNRAINEGITSLNTNERMYERSLEKGAYAEINNSYAKSTELCEEIRDIIGQDCIDKAYYSGDLDGFTSAVDSLIGKGQFELLSSNIDKAEYSKNAVERSSAMKEAQNIIMCLKEAKDK